MRLPHARSTALLEEFRNGERRGEPGRGIGEIGITEMPAAIANAVYQATAKRIRDLPITPDKLIVA